MDIIKVSSKSAPQKVAGALANLFRESNDSVEMQAIGAGALNQAIKGIAIARGYCNCDFQTFFCRQKRFYVKKLAFKV